MFTLTHPEALLWLEYAFCRSQLFFRRLEFLFLVLNDAVFFALFTDTVS